MATKWVVNVTTGVREEVPLTPQEEADAAAAFAAEQAANAIEADPATKEAACIAALNGGGTKIDLRKVIIAKAVSDEAYRLGKAPGALTGPELTALRQRIANIYKTL